MVDIMAVGAHPDDVEIAAGGTLLKMRAAGHSVLICCATNGEPTPRGSVETRLAEAQAPGPEALAVQAEFRASVAAAVESLPQTECLVIALYYHEDLTLSEIADIFGVTESRVCQIHTQAVLRLRNRLAHQAVIPPESRGDDPGS